MFTTDILCSVSLQMLSNPGFNENIQCMLITSGIINVEIQGLFIQVISSVLALEVLVFKIDEAQDNQTKLFTLSPFMFIV